MKYIIAYLSIFTLSLNLYPAEKNQVYKFKEIWGYVISGQEKYFNKDFPITDIGYFSAYPDTNGILQGIPDPVRLKAPGRKIHLVLTDSNSALVHFMLNGNLPFRKNLLESIHRAAEKFDGIQVDFEHVSRSDKMDFFSFLNDLKNKNPGKILSIALPARKRNFNDAYDYMKISPIADKIIIMAYDQHWSGSSPGPIAGSRWCREISSYIKTIISPEKLVMGIPFYGRSWTDRELANAYRFQKIQEIIEEKKLSEKRTTDGIPYTRYSENVNVILYYEDASSILSKAEIYSQKGINNISFWRIGLEDPGIWKYFSAFSKN